MPNGDCIGAYRSEVQMVLQLKSSHTCVDSCISAMERIKYKVGNVHWRRELFSGRDGETIPSRQWCSVCSKPIDGELKVPRSIAKGLGIYHSLTGYCQCSASIQCASSGIIEDLCKRSWYYVDIKGETLTYRLCHQVCIAVLTSYRHSIGGVLSTVHYAAAVVPNCFQSGWKT